MNVATADLCDAFEDRLTDGRLRVVEPGLLSFGRRRSFSGQVRTLKLFEDNSLLAQAVKRPGSGNVLVVDGGGSPQRALLGGNLAKAAADNGWSGIIVFGAVRDVDEIDACDIGVRALAVCPRRSLKRGTGEIDVVVEFLGARLRPGEWVYADRDGVVVSTEQMQTAD